MAYCPVILTKGDRLRLHKIKLRLRCRMAVLDAETARVNYQLDVCHEQMRQLGIPVPPPRPTQGELDLCTTSV